MKDNVRILTLGGLDEDGKNLTIVEVNSDIYVLDCGIKYSDKTTPGIDYIIPNMDYLKRNKNRIKAYIITHGHDDQLGALVYAYQDAPAPIYCGNVTKTMIDGFAEHHKLGVKYEYCIVKPSCSVRIENRKVTFFHTAHNIAESMGVAIETDGGNIVYSGDFIIDYSSSDNYLHDNNAISKLIEKPTLALMIPSIACQNLGYTAPKHKITPLLADVFKTEASGRIIISIYSTNTFNIDEIVKLAIAHKRKIIPYDQESLDMIKKYQKANQLIIDPDYFRLPEDINRYREQDIVILLIGFGVKLQNKIFALADKTNNDRRITLNSNDTFVVAAPPSLSMEVLATKALNELFKTDATIVNLSKKKLRNMQPSEEDIQMLLSIFKPKYYIPIKGLYQKLISNAKIAIDMNIGLNHHSIFLLENGMSIVLNEKGGRYDFDYKVKVGDVLIDGKGMNEKGVNLLIDRQVLGGEGVVILSAVIDSQKRKIISNVSTTIKGFNIIKDREGVVRELQSIFTREVQEQFGSYSYNIEEAKKDIQEKCLKYLRRVVRKSPLVMVIIESVN